MANIPLKAQSSQNSHSSQLLHDIALMSPLDGEGCVALGNTEVGYLVYTKAEKATLAIEEGRYTIYEVNASTGEITEKQKNQQLSGTFTLGDTNPNRIFWLVSHQ